MHALSAKPSNTTRQIGFRLRHVEYLSGLLQFLIIWSGNLLQEEIPSYLDRIPRRLGRDCSLDFVFHWFIPFTLLLLART